MLLEQILVFRLADEGSAGKENLPVAPMLEFVLDLLWSGLEAKVSGLRNQRLTVNQVIGGALRKKR